MRLPRSRAVKLGRYVCVCLSITPSYSYTSARNEQSHVEQLLTLTYRTTFVWKPLNKTEFE